MFTPSLKLRFYADTSPFSYIQTIYFTPLQHPLFLVASCFISRSCLLHFPWLHTSYSFSTVCFISIYFPCTIVRYSPCQSLVKSGLLVGDYKVISWLLQRGCYVNYKCRSNTLPSTLYPFPILLESNRQYGNLDGNSMCI